MKFKEAYKLGFNGFIVFRKCWDNIVISLDMENDDKSALSVFATELKDSLQIYIPTLDDVYAEDWEAISIN